MPDPIAEDTACPLRTWRNLGGSERETCILLTGFHSARGGHASCRWTVTNIPAWLWTLHSKIPTHKIARACLCNSGLAVVGKTNIFLIGSKASCTKQDSSLYWEPEQNLWLGRLKVPLGKQLLWFSFWCDVPVRLPSKLVFMPIGIISLTHNHWGAPEMKWLLLWRGGLFLSQRWMSIVTPSGGLPTWLAWLPWAGGSLKCFRLQHILLSTSFHQIRWIQERSECREQTLLTWSSEPQRAANAELSRWTFAVLKSEAA